MKKARRHDGYGREFYGCTNYPDYCTYTQGLEYTSEGYRGQARYSGFDEQTYAPASYEYRSSIPLTPYQRSYRKKSRSSDYSRASAEYESPACPECGSTMVKRKNHRGQFFWGCSRYPSCHGTRNYP